MGAEVLLIGMGPTALAALDSLSAKLTVVGVVRDVDVHAQAIDAVAHRAQLLGIPVHPDILPANIEELVLHLKPSCVVVSSYNRILGSRVLKQCPFINVHYSPLPRYRGRANVNWALINDELYAGITVHVIAHEMDAGNIIFQQVTPIRDGDTIAGLYERLNEIQKEKLAGAVLEFLNGYQGVPQPHHEATYGCARNPADGEIDWNFSTRRIWCLVRALTYPFPGAYTFFRGRRLTIWSAEPVDQPLNYVGRVSGRVVNISRADGYVDVLTGDGILRLFEVQLDGETKSAASAIIKSVRDTLGMRTIDLLGRIHMLEQQVEKLVENRKKSETGAK